MNDEAVGSERPTKAELLERVVAAQEALQRAIDGLGDDEMTAVSAETGWSVKDHLAHLTTWQHSLLALLQGRSRSEAVGVDRDTYGSVDTDALNALIDQRNKDLPLATVLTSFHETNARVESVLTAMTDDDLFRPYSHYQPDDLPYNAEPVIGWIAGNTFGHFEEHRGWIEEIIRRQRS